MDRPGPPQRSKSPRQVYQYLVRRYYWRSKVAWSAWIASTASIDRTFPSGIEIAEDVWVGPYVVVLSHDMTRGVYLPTRIGARSIVGVRAVILPGVTVGEDCVIQAGSVVSRDIPSGQQVAGNPARSLRDPPGPHAATHPA